MRYWPVPSVTSRTDLFGQRRAGGLDDTPGSTAPLESLTTPAIVACANAADAVRGSSTAAMSPVLIRVLTTSLRFAAMSG